MKKHFAIGDHVAWDSEAGRVSGRIIEVRTADFDDTGTRIAPVRTTPGTRSRATRPTTSPRTGGGVLRRLPD